MSRAGRKESRERRRGIDRREVVECNDKGSGQGRGRVKRDGGGRRRGEKERDGKKERKRLRGADLTREMKILHERRGEGKQVKGEQIKEKRRSDQRKRLAERRVDNGEKALYVSTIGKEPMQEVVTVRAARHKMNNVATREEG